MRQWLNDRMSQWLGGRCQRKARTGHKTDCLSGPGAGDDDGGGSDCDQHAVSDHRMGCSADSRSASPTVCPALLAVLVLPLVPQSRPLIRTLRLSSMPSASLTPTILLSATVIACVFISAAEFAGRLRANGCCAPPSSSQSDAERERESIA